MAIIAGRVAAAEIMPVREKYSKNVGIWLGEAGQPSEVLHMWNYPSLETRMKIRAAVAADSERQGFLKKGAGMLVEMQSTLLRPTSYSIMK